MAKANPLVDLLTSLGVPLLKSVVTGSLPPPLNMLSGKAIDVLAARLGTKPTPEAIVASYEAHPEATAAVIRDVEANPEVILAGVAQQRETNVLFAQEASEPWWAWAWRPAGMWGLGALWFWNIIVLHVINAVFKIALPPADAWLLLQLSALYMGLYMGGHTVKDFAAKKWGAT